MLRNFMAMALFGALVACGDDGDSGKTDTTDNTTDTDAGGGDTTGCASGGGACWFGDTVCIDYSSGAEAWCGGVGGDYEAAACAGGEDASCDIPAGGSSDYAECATAYYYGNSDAEGACSGAGGTLN